MKALNGIREGQAKKNLLFCIKFQMLKSRKIALLRSDTLMGHRSLDKDDKLITNLLDWNLPIA